jgi:hypothetical protein
MKTKSETSIEPPQSLPLSSPRRGESKNPKPLVSLVVPIFNEAAVYDKKAGN